MNNKIVSFLKNFYYALISNLISLIISSLIIIVVPKLIGVKEYGYWQLYLFYSAYVGFLHFGWNDGIYLRYGGERYEELNKYELFSQFYMMIVLQISLAIIGLFISDKIFSDSNKIFVVRMISINLVLFNVRSMLLFILQATNRIKEYARITIFDKVTLLIWGEHDDATPLWMGKRMEEEIKDAGLVVFENDGHYAYWNQLNRFHAIVNVFLEEDASHV